MREQTTEHRLHASEERFHALVDAVTDYAIFMLDPSGCVATWNRGAEAIKGYTAEEIVGRPFAVFYPAEDRAWGKPERVLDRVRQEGRFAEEGWRVRKNGSRFWASVVITALRDPRGDIAGFAKVTQDLTSKRALEHQLHASEERFHALVDAVTDYAIFMLDANGCVATWNRGAEAIKGYTSEEIVGRHFGLFYPPEDRASGKPAMVLDQVRREGRFEEEAWRVRKDGSRFWASIVVTALRDPQGEIVGFAKVTRDLTTKRAAEEAARRLAREQLARAVAETERRRLLSLLQQVPGIVNYLRGPELVVEFAHPKTLEMLGGRDVVGKPLLEAIPEHRGQPYHERLLRVYRTGETFAESEVPAAFDVGGRETRSYWNSVYLPVRDSAGDVEGVMTFDVDVTEAVRARQELERASEANALAREELERMNRAKDEFLATLSHELRTPLNAISGWAAILLRNAPADPAKLARGLEVIERNAQAQTHLISDLLDVSRIISGKVQLRMDKVELARTIHEAVDVVRPATVSKGVRVVLDLDPALGATLADRDRLHQILWNLLINAVRFTPRGGRIDIEARRGDSGVVVRVTDTGIGIAREHLPHVFERFRQVDSSRSRAHGGLGLGLAIVRHLVELHGGSVEANSEGLGRGASFTVRLPIRAVHRPPALSEPDVGQDGERPQQRTAPIDLKGVRVLVVDDDPDSRELLRTVLEEAGVRLTLATSAREALDAAGPFDLIISDVGMPEADGYALMRSLRARGTDIPAIALTAYAGSEDVELAKRAGFHEHLAKPVDQRVLLETVKAWTRPAGSPALERVSRG